MLDWHWVQDFLGQYGDELAAPVRSFDIAGRPFDFAGGRPYLMGVINLSADSAYRESIVHSSAEAIERGLALIESGAEVIDLGAESSLPHAARVSANAQIEKLLPAVESLAAAGAIVSVESYHAEVMQQTAAAGARVFNLSGQREQDDVFRLAKRHQAAVILPYLPGNDARQRRDVPFHGDPLPYFQQYFARRLAQAEKAGIHRCLIDPGLGFYHRNLPDGALRVRHQLLTILHTLRLRRLGYPVFNILPHAPLFFDESHRRAAEPCFAVLALLSGVHLIRTHEIDTVARIRNLLALV